MAGMKTWLAIGRSTLFAVAALALLAVAGVYTASQRSEPEQSRANQTVPVAEPTIVQAAIAAMPTPALRFTPDGGVRADSHDRIPRGASADGDIAVCVQGVGDAEALTPRARTVVEQVFTELQRYPAWQRMAPILGSVVVFAGCPGSPFLLRPDVDWVDGLPANPNQSFRPEDDMLVERWGGTDLFVFFLTPEDKRRAIRGESDACSAPQEYVCDRSVPLCGVMLSACYFSTDEVDNLPFIRYWLATSIGLLDALPSATPPPAGAVSP